MPSSLSLSLSILWICRSMDLVGYMLFEYSRALGPLSLSLLCVSFQALGRGRAAKARKSAFPREVDGDGEGRCSVEAFRLAVCEALSLPRGARRDRFSQTGLSKSSLIYVSVDTTYSKNTSKECERSSLQGQACAWRAGRSVCGARGRRRRRQLRASSLLERGLQATRRRRSPTRPARGVKR